MQQGQRTYFMQLSQQQSAYNQNDPLPNSWTGVQRDRSPGIVSVRHHMQAAHPNSSPKAQAILLTKTIMHVKLLAYILNSVWIHYIMLHSSSCCSSSSYSSSTHPCLWHPHPLHATELTLQDLHTPPYMPCPVQSIGICF